MLFVCTMYLVHQELALAWFGYVYHLLHDVVGELIFHHGIECAVIYVAHLLNQSITLHRLAIGHTLFYNIARELTEQKKH